jgi:uncharacterized RDD family membrane protein YckC
MSTIRVQTAQNVAIEYETASLGDRIVASLIDYSLYFAWYLLWALLGRKLQLLGIGNIGSLLVSLPTLFYFLVCEIFFNGQTLGKKAMHLRVVRLDGTRPRLGDFFLRWLLRPIDVVMSMGVVAILTILVNGRGQRLGDLAAGTAVISVRRRVQPDALMANALLPMPGYQAVFPQAATLTDHDIALIRKLLYHSSKQENYLLLNEVANKVKALTGIRTDLQDAPFLTTLLRDHAHLSMGSSE